MVSEKPFVWPKRDPNVKPKIYPNFKRDYKLLCELTPEEHEYVMEAYQEELKKYKPLEGTSGVILIDFFPENADWLCIMRSERMRLEAESVAEDETEH